MKNYLALDLGTKCGVAFIRGGGVVFSHWDLTPGSGESGGYGARFVKFSARLTAHCGAAPVEHILYEEVRAHRGTRAAHIHGGFLAILAAWAESHAIPMTGVGVGTIKRRIAGRGNATKQEVKAACIARGFVPKTFDEADALALLLGVLELESSTS